METLYEKLAKYQQSDYYPFHMPGHKRNISFIEKLEEGSCKQDLQVSFSGGEEKTKKNNIEKRKSIEQGNFQIKQKEVSSFMWNSYNIDITEIEGFDNLHDAGGILKDAMERAAKVCGAGKTYFLVNGSTCGLLAGINACVQHGDTIIVARNCHKAVYHAIELNELVPRYIYPQEVKEYGVCGGIFAENLKEMLITYPNAKLVVVTSPTYEGVVSDIQALADTAHEFGIPLLVDEAHGAHFGQSDFFPKSALSCGADIVIQSMHKTLPAFTQTALLHLGKNTIADRERIEKYLSIYQTSSPSYLFMSSIDWCMDFLEKKPKKVFQAYEERLRKFYKRAEKLDNMIVFCPISLDRMYRETVYKNVEEKSGIFDFDYSKLNIFVKAASGITGRQLYDILLEKYHLQMEMVSKDYVLAMTSICDTDEGMERLIEALEDIDRERVREIDYKMLQKKVGQEKKQEKQEWDIEPNTMEQITEILKRKEQCKKMNPALCSRNHCMWHNPIKYTPYQVQYMQGKSVLFTESRGMITKEYIYLYPPGIPLLVPGEEITLELIGRIKIYKNEGLKICGQKEDGYIVVVDE